MIRRNPITGRKLYNLPLVRLEEFQRAVKGSVRGQRTGRLKDDTAGGGREADKRNELPSMDTINPNEIRGHFLHDVKHKFCVCVRIQHSQKWSLGSGAETKAAL